MHTRTMISPESEVEETPHERLAHNVYKRTWRAFSSFLVRKVDHISQCVNFSLNVFLNRPLRDGSRSMKDGCEMDSTSNRA